MLTWNLSPKWTKIIYLCNHALDRSITNTNTCSALSFAILHHTCKTRHTASHIIHYVQWWMSCNNWGSPIQSDKHNWNWQQTLIHIKTPISLSTANRPRLSSPLWWELLRPWRQWERGGRERRRGPGSRWRHFSKDQGATLLDHESWLRVAESPAQPEWPGGWMDI